VMAQASLFKIGDHQFLISPEMAPSDLHSVEYLLLSFIALAPWFDKREGVSNEDRWRNSGHAGPLVQGCTTNLAARATRGPLDRSPEDRVQVCSHPRSLCLRVLVLDLD
jgi:hypothetical protein